MSQGLADALADIDNAETIERLLSAFNEQSNPSIDTDQPTLSKLYQRYLDRRQNRSPATIAQYKRTIPDFQSFVSDKEITSPNELTTELVDSYVDYLLNEYNSDSTICTYTKNVSAWFNWIHKRGLCEQSV